MFTEVQKLRFSFVIVFKIAAFSQKQKLKKQHDTGIFYWLSSNDSLSKYQHWPLKETLRGSTTGSDYKSCLVCSKQNFKNIIL